MMNEANQANETSEIKSSSLSIQDFLNRTSAFLDERCVKGTAAAVSRAEVAKAGGLSEENDTLISELINAGFMPGWKIRQGRDGGVCRVGEELVKGPNPNRFQGEWLAQLIGVLNANVSLNSKVGVTRNVIARELVKLTNEDILALPNRISEAISLGRCPGFESKRGSGIFRKPVKVTEATEAPAVSADAADVADVTEEPSEVVASEATSEPSDAPSDAPSEVLAEQAAETTTEEPAEAPKNSRRRNRK